MPTLINLTSEGKLAIVTERSILYGSVKMADGGLSESELKKADAVRVTTAPAA